MTNKDALCKTYDENREDKHNMDNATGNQNLRYRQNCIKLVLKTAKKNLPILGLIFREKSKQVTEIHKLTDF